MMNYNEKYNKLSYLIKTSTSRNNNSYLYNKIKSKYEKGENKFFQNHLQKER